MTAEPPDPRTYCPGCEPTTDPIREFVMEQRCFRHQPERTGLDDGLVPADALLGSYDIDDGHENRLRCDLIHRAGRKESV